MTYEQFLASKAPSVKSTGISESAYSLIDGLKPHQEAICKWAIEGGCRAIFADFGLGKTVMQLQVLSSLAESHGGKSLVIAPLGVRQEFYRDAERFFGIKLKFVRRDCELDGDGFYITNYESVRDGKLDPNQFDAVSLDEASVLRGYGTKTYQTFLDIFKDVRYRFVATATPEPNRVKELIHYAGFLGIMDTGQALTRFFQRDSTKANNLTLYPHKVDEFWEWVHGWAIFINKPSDLGFSDDGYVFPEMEINWHEVGTTSDRYRIDNFGQGELVAVDSQQLSEMARFKRDSITERVAKCREIVDASPDDHFILWHTLEDERKVLQKEFAGSKAVFGTQDLDERENLIIGFSNGDYRILSTKPELCGSGCNFQHHCHREVFVGIDYRFNDFIQAIHRVARFGQTKKVVIDIIYTDTERSVKDVLIEKWESHKETRKRMSELIKEKGLVSGMAELTKRSMGCERKVETGQSWTAINNDCVVETMSMADNSVDEIITSIPFSNHYEYTPSYNDFGHTNDNDHFWAQMDFLTPNLLRILKPGRMYCCHVKDRILFGNVTGQGVPTVSPFHAEALMHGIKHGFQYMGMITVVTDVVRENNQTYRLGWSEQCKDGTKMGAGSPEYILLFRKPQSDLTRGYADVPVEKSKDSYTRGRWQIDAHAFWRSSGNRFMNPDELFGLGPDQLAGRFPNWTLQSIYDYDNHVEVAEALEVRGKLPSTFMAVQPGSNHPEVWSDVSRMHTLNGLQAQKGKQLHVCPLQFDIVERLIERYSNPGDLVFDPFGGLMTVPYCAIAKGRRGMATELNTGYWKDGISYLKNQELKVNSPTLFDGLDLELEVA